MSDHDRASQGRFVRLCGTLKACLSAGFAPGRRLARLLSGRSRVAADELDERTKRDIGFEGRGWQDQRSVHYRTLLRHGQPLP